MKRGKKEDCDEDKAREIPRSKLEEAVHLEDPNLCKLWVGAELEEGFLIYTREEKPFLLVFHGG